MESMINSVPGIEEDLNRLKRWTSCTPLVKPVRGGRGTTRLKSRLNDYFLVDEPNDYVDYILVAERLRRLHLGDRSRDCTANFFLHRFSSTTSTEANRVDVYSSW